MAVQEMTQLRPRSIGELLDQAIRQYRKKFLTYVGIIAVMQVPLTLLQLLVTFFTYRGTYDELLSQSGAPSAGQLGTLISGSLANIVLAIMTIVLVQGIAASALVRAMADNYLGEDTGILDAYKKSAKIWPKLVGGLLLVGIVAIAAFVWLLIPLIGWITGPGLLAFLSLMVAPMIAPSVVLEKKKAGAAFSRAWFLAKKRFWWLCGYMLILALFGYIVVSAPVQIIEFFFQSRTQQAILAGSDVQLVMWQTILTALLQMLLGLLYQPLHAVGAMLAYFDLRIRFEGFDLAVLAEQSDEGAEVLQADAITSAGLPESSGGEQAFSVNLVGSFVGLSLIVGTFYGIIFGFGILMASLFGPGF